MQDDESRRLTLRETAYEWFMERDEAVALAKWFHLSARSRQNFLDWDAKGRGSLPGHQRLYEDDGRLCAYEQDVLPLYEAAKLAADACAQQFTKALHAGECVLSFRTKLAGSRLVQCDRDQCLDLQIQHSLGRAVLAGGVGRKSLRQLLEEGCRHSETLEFRVSPVRPRSRLPSNWDMGSFLVARISKGSAPPQTARPERSGISTDEKAPGKTRAEGKHQKSDDLMLSKIEARLNSGDSPNAIDAMRWIWKNENNKTAGPTDEKRLLGKLKKRRESHSENSDNSDRNASHSDRNAS